MPVAQQLHAVEKAIGNGSLEALPREARDLLKELQGVTKYL